MVGSLALGGASVQNRQMGARWLIAAIGLLVVGCDARDEPFVLNPVKLASGNAQLELSLAAGYVPGTLSARLDGASVDVNAFGIGGLVRPVSLQFDVGGGTHVLSVRAHFLGVDGSSLRSERFSFFVPTPVRKPEAALLSSWPAQGTRELPRGEWIQLEFSSAPSQSMVESFALGCGKARLTFDMARYRDSFVVINPVGQLPAAERCVFAWTQDSVHRSLLFATAGQGEPAVIEYDREARGLSSPFPDDYFTRRDPSSPTRLRVDLPVVDTPSRLDVLGELLISDVSNLDGFSPVGHIYIALSDAIDFDSLPHNATESVHPASAVQLIDVDPRSETFGERIPFDVELRADYNEMEVEQHSLLLLPLLPSQLGGKYAVVVTRALRAAADRPFEPSPFMSRVLAPRREDDSKAVRRARARVASALWVVEHVESPPVPRDDIALVVAVTTGTLGDISKNMLRIRRRIHKQPLPEFSIDSVERESGAVEAIVHGTWYAPQFRTGNQFVRDSLGRLAMDGSTPIAFTLALPRERAEAGAPLVIYQHGNPGNAAREVPVEARRGLAEAGFAVLGFTDVFNRELSASMEPDTAIFSQFAAAILALMKDRELPEFWLQTHAEQLAFVRLAQALSSLDVLPIGQGDGVPDLDLAAPIAYLGVSDGANHAPAFLAYAPEISAATLIAGGAPIAELLTHQLKSSFGSHLARLLMSGDSRELWLALSLLQTALDRQDPIHHARHLYRDPIAVDGVLRKPSLLLISGVQDTRVPNRFTESLAWLLGRIPLVAASLRPVAFLPVAQVPVQSNMGPMTTAGYAQIVPAGIVGARTDADCDATVIGEELAREGHFCAQVAPVSILQRVSFFGSALSGGAPIISNPLSGSLEGEQPQALPADSN